MSLTSTPTIAAAGKAPGRPAIGGLWRYAAAVGIVLASALCAGVLHHLLNTTRLSMVFLAGVVVAAASLGARPGYLAAGLAFVTYDFYLAEPRFQLQFTSAEDGLALVVFLFVAMLTGGLAGRARDEGVKARTRAANSHALYQASRALSSTWDEAAIRQQLAEHMAIAAGGSAMVWSPAGSVTAPAAALPPQALLADVIDLSRLAATEGTLLFTSAGWRLRFLSQDAPILGVVAWESAAPGAARDEQDRLVNVLADLGAAAILRAQLGAVRSEMAAKARTEELRNALLTSVSHDFRTPLAAILASASSLRELHADLDQASREDLLATIQEEAERLNRFVANLLHMSRLEAGVVEADKAVVDVADVVDQVARRFGRGRDGGRVVTHIKGLDLLVRGDAILLEHALANVVENALRFSVANAPVDITCRRAGDRVVVEVLDEGPGVPAEHMDRIFDKFFQTGDVRPEAAGTGLGLSIARGLVEAMHGSIVAANRTGQPGLQVALAVPLAA